MNRKSFRIVLICLIATLLAEFGYMIHVAATPPTKEVANIESYKRERDAWCLANTEASQKVLDLTQLKISDNYFVASGLPIPLTTVTIRGTIWQELDVDTRKVLELAVRCHSKHRYGGQMRYVDLNGAVLQKALFD